MFRPPPLVSENGSLKPTPAKTRLPVRTVLPKPPRRPSYTAAQEATLHAKQLLAPLYAQADTEAARQNRAIQAYTTAVMQQLAGIAPQIQADYSQAIGAHDAMVNAAANSLRAANPNADVQKLLDAVGAPAAQGQQIAGNLNNTFNGGAAVGQYVNGALPLGSLQAQGEAATSLARLQPGIAALAGRQSLAAALAQQADARAQIAAQQPKLEADWLQTFKDNAFKRQQLADNQIALGLTQQNKNRDYNLKVQQFNARQKAAVDKFNSQQTDKANTISVGVSRGANDGYAHNSQGAIVYDAHGKPVPFAKAPKKGAAGGTKPPSPSQINSLVTAWKNGKSTTQSIKQPNPDANGNAVYRTKRVTTGKLSFGQAYRRLVAMGLNDKQARKYLATAYKRGEQGRAWLTNEEQAVLRAAKRVRPTSHNYRGVHYLDRDQAAALKAAGQMPPGHWIQGSTRTQDLGPIYVIAQTY